MTSIVYRAAKDLIEARWRAQDAPPPSKSLFFQSVALDSHRPDKFSRHLIIKVYIHDTASEEPKTRPLPLISNSHAGSLAKAIVARGGGKVKVQKKPPNDAAAPEFTSFVDTAVYSTSRAFRTIGSSKETASRARSGSPYLRRIRSPKALALVSTRSQTSEPYRKC